MAPDPCGLSETTLTETRGSGWILPLTQAVFYLSALSAWIAGGVQLTHWGLPGLAAWCLSWVGGALFGLLMADSLVRLPKLNRLYEAVPVNGATGAQLSAPELVIPFLQISILLAIMVPVFERGRVVRHLPPFTPPEWVVYLPWLLAVPMVAARGYAYARRDPNAERQRAEDEARRQEESLALNEETRKALRHCAEELLVCWDRNPFADPSALLLDKAEFEQLEGAVCRGIALERPEDHRLHAARCFISDVLHAAYRGRPMIIGNGVPFKAPRKLEWDEAIMLLREVAEYLRGERPLDNPRFWEFTGWRPRE